MNPHFFTAPFYFAFIWFRVEGSRFKVEGSRFRVQGSRFRGEVAASPPFLEDGILALSEQIHAYVEKNNDGQSLPRMGKVASRASRIGF